MSGCALINGLLTPEGTVLDDANRDQSYFYPPEAARTEADRLAQQIDYEPGTVPIVKGHHDPETAPAVDDIIGRAMVASYVEGEGVLFGGEILDGDIARKIDRGYLGVSPTTVHTLGDYNDEKGAHPVTNPIAVRDIAIVGRGQPGTFVEVVESLDEEELADAEVDARP